MMSIHVETFYWLPHCSTCQKANEWLASQGVLVNAYHDLKASPLSTDTLSKLVTGIGSVDALFSKRAMKYRAWGLHEKVLSEEDKLHYMQQEYTFIKRPALFLSNGTVLAGFATKQWLAAFQG
ncbi:MAG: arsenate reductase family protein [Vampirovibrionales bacterium]